MGNVSRVRRVLHRRAHPSHRAALMGPIRQCVASSSFIRYNTIDNITSATPVGRLVAGFGVGALSAAVPMYQAETAPPQIRGTLTGTYQLFITFGILIACKPYSESVLFISQHTM